MQSILIRMAQVDPENIPPHPTVPSNDRPDVIVRFVELLPQIIHGHGPTHLNGSNRLHDLDHERLD